MITEIGGLSDIGCIRQQNEDDFRTQTWPEHHLSLAIVADGMGGYKGGAMASRLAVAAFLDSVSQWLKTKTHNSITAIQLSSQLTLAASAANSTVWDRRQADTELAKMGTTLVALAVLNGHAHIIHAGDSRCYRLALHGDQLEQLTRDDTVAQQMLDAGAMTESEAQDSPLQHILSKALGPEPELEFSMTSAAIDTGDALLLCTDGLYNCVSETDMINTMIQSASAQQLCDQLIQQAIQGGGKDNITAALLKINKHGVDS